MPLRQRTQLGPHSPALGKDRQTDRQTLQPEHTQLGAFISHNLTELWEMFLGAFNSSLHTIEFNWSVADECRGGEGRGAGLAPTQLPPFPRGAGAVSPGMLALQLPGADSLLTHTHGGVPSRECVCWLGRQQVFIAGMLSLAPSTELVKPGLQFQLQQHPLVSWQLNQSITHS